MHAQKLPWTGPTRLLDLHDKDLRQLAKTLAHGRRGEREVAMAIHRHVRAMPLAAGLQWRPRKASDVIRRGRADALDKTTLLVALLRSAGIPARVVFAPPWHEALAGLPMDICVGPRPLAEVQVSGQWIHTDVYLFDSAYLSAARARLQKKRAEFGYGIAATSATDWDAARHAYLLGADHEDDLLRTASPPFDDVEGFMLSLSPLRRGLRYLALAAWNLKARQLARVLAALRGRHARRERPQHAGELEAPSQS